MTQDTESETEDKEEEEEVGAKVLIPSTVPDNIIELKHSFGYDCKRLFNLCLIDEDTLIFASGNLLHYYSISKNSFTFRRTVYGCGVGFIIKNHIPTFNYITIAENGNDPTVFIYRYPEHEIIAELKGGAVRSFTCGVYSNNGELMATQAGYPDFMLTIWNWQTNSIILRSKAYQNDVLSVTFSHFNPILLASCGLSHVQFWKMARTFTGLKLKSDLGRFGKTDACDVYAVYVLVDEKVISGCEWGNMLVWEGGLIKLEVTRKARKPCHKKPITSILWMGNNEVMTIGMDGYARIWFWETVDLADPPEEDRFVEIDPIYEFRIGDRDESCESRHLVKAKPFEESNFEYYSQDGKGGVWLCDLNTITNPKPPKKLFSCHGGRVVAGQASPVSSHIATLGEDGKVNIYNYETEELLLQEPFNAPGGDLLWLDTSVDPSGIILILGFGDGVVRQVALELDDEKKQKAQIHLIYAIKPHSKPVTCLGVSPSGNILISSALDKTAFLFHIKKRESGYVELVALGFLLFTGSPICLHWNKNKSKTVLIGCQTGEVYECDLPEPETIDLFKARPTWRIEAVSSRMLKFTSVKSGIRREIEKTATLKRKAKKLAAKKKEIKRLMEINPGLQIDDSALADSSESDEEEAQKPLHIPDPPNPVLWLQYTNEGTIWLSMGGYDAGYVYEVKFGEEEPVSCTIIPEADDIAIHSYLYIDSYLVFGMQTGQIRINAIKPDFRELNDFWQISMHDNLNGVIPRIFTSRDGKWFFSIGHDGNIFYYHWNGPVVERKCAPPTAFIPLSKIAKDIEDPNHLSLEEVKIKENLIKLRAFEEAERKRLQPSFAVLQLQVDWITDKTKDLYQAKLNAVIEKLDHDVTGACQDAQDLYNLMFLSLEYIPFEVFAISKDLTVRVFRLPKLKMDSEFVIAEIEQEKSKSSTIGVESVTTLAGSKTSKTPWGVIIYDFAEKVLLKFYIRILEFFSLLKQIKTEELEQVMELCGGEFDLCEEDEYSIDGVEGAAVVEQQEEEENDEKEEISVVEKAIRFLNNSIQENVEVKNLEISIIHEILHVLKSEYNNKVIVLKMQKARLYEKYKRVKQEMIEAEISIDLPPLRELVMYNEYPDEILKEPFIAPRSFESILWEKPMEYVNETEEEEEMLEELEEDEMIVTEEPSEQWIVGMENLAGKVHSRILIFDEELTRVVADRLRYEVEIKYLDLLEEISSQELIILQESELIEKDLVERDEAAKISRNEIGVSIKRLKSEIDETIKNSTMMNDEIRKIQTEFNDAIKGNKFSKFLKRIFEKKFKPRKDRIRNDSESESSTEDSSTDEDDRAGSGNSGDGTAIRLDESHCPTGCDRKLYDLAFEFRTQRYALEQKIYDGNRSNDIRRTEIDQLIAKIPVAEELCSKEHTNLLVFRRQKLEKLLAIETAQIYSISGFGLEIQGPREEANDHVQYLETLLNMKKMEAHFLKEELQHPIETYTVKLRLLLQILEERESLRKKQPSVVEVVQSEETDSIVTIVRPPTPPTPFDFEAYAAEKIMKLVQRFFVRYLSKHISETYMRKYIPKVARCLGNIARNFTCELADNIIEVIVENLRRIIPKKYLMHASLDDIRSLFKDIVAVFELEPIEVNPVAVITECVEKSVKSFTKVKCANKTQRIILETSKLIIEELPMDDFRNPETAKLVAKLLAKEAVIIPNCLNVEILVEQIAAYAKEHMLSAVTIKIVRVYVDELLKELLLRKAAEVRSGKSKEKVCRDVRRKKREP